MNTNKKTFGEFLYSKMEEMGISKKVISQKLNVTERVVNQWQCDRNRPLFTTLIELAKILKISIDDMLF